MRNKGPWDKPVELSLDKILAIESSVTIDQGQIADLIFTSKTLWAKNTALAESNAELRKRAEKLENEVKARDRFIKKERDVLLDIEGRFDSVIYDGHGCVLCGDLADDPMQHECPPGGKGHPK